MAQRTVVTLEDDIDGSPADETVVFGLDGGTYEIDLTAVHAEELREALAPYLSVARRIGGAPARSAPPRGRPGRRRTPAALLMDGKTRAGVRYERTGRPPDHDYALRGLVRCAACGRKMDASRNGGTSRYRCVARSLVPGTPAADGHPRTAYLREDAVVPALNRYLAGLLHPDRRAATLAELASTPERDDHAQQVDSARRRLADAQQRLARHARAIEAGVDPGALTDAVNAAHKDKVAAEHALAHAVATAPEPARRHDDLARFVAGIEAAHGTVAAAFHSAPPELLRDLYAALGVRVLYDPVARVTDATVNPFEPDPPLERPEAGGTMRVRGGT